jgi:hypothetical protein
MLSRTSVTWAGDLPKPVGKPILTIYGNIENTNENGKAVFDLASLEKLGVVSFETTSPWYNGRTKFEVFNEQTHGVCWCEGN